MDKTLMKLLDGLDTDEGMDYNEEFTNFCEKNGIDLQYAVDVLRLGQPDSLIVGFVGNDRKTRFKLSTLGVQYLNELRKFEFESRQNQISEAMLDLNKKQNQISEAMLDLNKMQNETNKSALLLNKETTRTQWIIVTVTVIGLIITGIGLTVSGWFDYQTNSLQKDALRLEQESKYPHFMLSGNCGEVNNGSTEISFLVKNLGEFADSLHAELSVAGNDMYLDDLHFQNSSIIPKKSVGQSIIRRNSGIIRDKWEDKFVINNITNKINARLILNFTCDNMVEPCSFIPTSIFECEYMDGKLVTTNECLQWK